MRWKHHDHRKRVSCCELACGEHMGDEDEPAGLYPQPGDMPFKRTPLYNGAIECGLFEYKIVAGSSRPK